MSQGKSLHCWVIQENTAPKVDLRKWNGDVEMTHYYGRIKTFGREILTKNSGQETSCSVTASCKRNDPDIQWCSSEYHLAGAISEESGQYCKIHRLTVWDVGRVNRSSGNQLVGSFMHGQAAERRSSKWMCVRLISQGGSEAGEAALEKDWPRTEAHLCGSGKSEEGLTRQDHQWQAGASMNTQVTQSARSFVFSGLWMLTVLYLLMVLSH